MWSDFRRSPRVTGARAQEEIPASYRGGRLAEEAFCVERFSGVRIRLLFNIEFK